MGKFVGIACLSLCLLFSSCNLVGDFLFESIDRTIQYEISGTASSVDIDFRNYNGNNVKLYDISLPWSETITVAIREFESFSPSIDVKNKGETGYVIVEIWVDDELIKKDAGNKAASASVWVNYDE